MSPNTPSRTLKVRPIPAGFFLVAFLIVWLTFPGGLPATGPSLPEDELGRLYTSRLTFTAAGVPEVNIGLMTGKERIRLDCSGGCLTRHYTSGGVRQLRIQQPQPVSVTIQQSQPGRVRHDIVVEEIARSRQDRIGARQADWESRGLPTRVEKIGSVIGLNGVTLDNLRYLLIAASHDDRPEAKAQLAALQQAHGAGIHLLSRIVALPRARLQVRSEDGSLLLESENIVAFSSPNHTPLTVIGCEYGQGFSDYGVADLAFDGTLLVTVDAQGQLALSNRLSLEEVLKGTVPAETFASAPAEALKAQAIAARGQLIGELGVRHLAEPFQLCATQHCQVYRGRNSRHPNTDAAVDATRGQFLVAQGRLLEPSYSASAGGYTTANETAWPQPPDPHRRPRLDGPPDPRFEGGITETNLDAFLDQPPVMYAAQAGLNQQRLRWSRDYSAEQLSALISRHHDIGVLRSIRVLGRGPSGRVLDLEIVGSKGRVNVTRELPIRRLLGNLPSALIRLRPTHDAEGRLLRLQIDGAGFGHGVGMCQTGAIGRAKSGQSAGEILNFYYSDAMLMTLY